MADRYWVGGTETWNATAGTKWSTTSGGGGGSAVPTSSDNVFFDGNSGTVVVTVGATVNSLSLNFTGFTGTFAGSSVVNVFGNIIYAAGMTLTHTGNVEFESTSTGRTVTTGGKTLTHGWIFKGVGGGWTLQDAVTNSASSNTQGKITLTNGTLDLNGQTINTWSFGITGTATRALVMGACTVQIRSTSTGTTDGFALASTTNFTLTENTGLVQFMGTSGAFNGSTETWYAVSTSAVTVSLSIRGGGTFTNITMTGVVGDAMAIFNLATGFTITGTLTITGNSAVQRIRMINSTSPGLQSTITAAAVALTNVDIQDVSGAGAATWSGTSVGDMGGNTGITFTAAVTRYWVGDGGNWNDTTHWSTSSGGSSGASVPLCHDTVIFDANSFVSAGQTVTANMPHCGKDVTFTGTNAPTYTFTPTSSDSSTNFFGDVSFASGATYIAANSAWIFNGRTNTTLTTNGKNFSDTTGVGFAASKGYAAGASVGTVSLADNFTAGTDCSLEIFSGGFDFNDKNVTVGSIGNYPFGGQMKFGTGTITITADENNSFEGYSITMQDFSDGLLNIFDAETSTVIIDTTNMTASAANLAVVNLYSDNSILYTFNKVIFTGHRAKVLEIQSDFGGAPVITTLEIKSEQAAKELQLWDDVEADTPIVITTLLVTGTPYSRTAINSDSSGLAATITITNSRIYFADIQDISFSASTTAFCSTSISGNTNLVLSTSALCKTVGASMSSYCQPNIY